MEGAALAAERNFDRDVSLAWHTGAFTGAAFAGQLRQLNDYRAAREPTEPQTPEEMLMAFQEMQKNGAPINIRQIN